MAKPYPLGLILLVIYKAATAIALLLISVAIRFAWPNHSYLSDYTLPSHRIIIGWILQHIAQVSPHTLQFAAIAAGLYGLLSAIEAIGLWYVQSWARWVVLVGVGASLPIEVLELLRAASWLKFGLLIINGLAFWYVLKRFPKKFSTH
jgi:uncharacterized membrane protein (DUF2068 family)